MPAARHVTKSWAFETICLGLSMFSFSFLFAALGAEFPIVALCFIYGLTVLTFGIQQQMTALEAQRRAESAAGDSSA
jgi:NADH:ubiquinone oxidoreductase subunit 6 (subunit J)